jgi:hypothetical protein
MERDVSELANPYAWDELTPANATSYSRELIVAGFDYHRFFIKVPLDGPFDLEVKRGFFDRQYAIQILPVRKFGAISAADVAPSGRKRAVLAMVLMIPGIQDFSYLIPETSWPGHTPLLGYRSEPSFPDRSLVREVYLTEDNLPLLVDFTFERIASVL